MRHPAKLLLWALGCSVFLAGAFPAFAQQPDLDLLVQPLGDSETSPGRAPGAQVPIGPAPKGSISLYDASLADEVEPNGTFLSASPIALVNGRALVQGTIFPVADIDFYSFQGTAGDKVFAATMTAFAGSTNSVLEIRGSNGNTIIEADDDDGSFSTTSSSIAGATLPTTGIYFIRVAHSSATSDMKPYRLFLQLRPGNPVAETETNDVIPEPLPASGFVSGAISSATDAADRFSFAANAGDTVYLSLDADPARTLAATWNPRLALGPVGGFNLLVNDGNATGPNSEAFFFTVNEAGTYYAQVDPSTAGSGTPAFTYRLNVTVIPRVAASSTCQTFTNSTATALSDLGLTTSTINVPISGRISDVNLILNATHARMTDLDVGLAGPTGAFVGVFNDIGSATADVAGLTAMNLQIDDEAAVPANSFTVMSNARYTPESFARMDFFDGMPANGTWTLNIYDDTTGNTGTLNSWGVEICTAPPPPACAAGTSPVTVYATDFEASDGGFTSSGTLNEWERGTPSLAPITTCANGSNCFKTDLDGTYENLANYTLRSPTVNLTNPDLRAPVLIEWAQKYQLENAVFDSYAVGVQQVGVPASLRTLYSWVGPTMTFFAASPTLTLNQVSGWGSYRTDISSFLGQNMEMTFALATDSSGVFSGVAVDDVRITACQRVAGADVSINKTDSPDPVIAGNQVTYAITAANAGPDAANGLQVSDALPLETTFVSVTASLGSTCTAPAVGSNGSVVCTWAGPTAVGTLRTVTIVARVLPATAGSTSISNTANVANLVNDPNTLNNASTAITAVLSQADLAISKTDGRTSAIINTAGTYTIVASNPTGPSQVNALVTDVFAANFQAPVYTVAAAGGATCGANGAGNLNQTITLPVGSTCTFTVNGTYRLPIGNLSNTASIAAVAPSTDPNPANNSATDVTQIVSPATLSATKTVAAMQNPPAGEQRLMYTVVIRNAGPATQLDNPGDEFVDVLPASWRMLGFTASSGTLSYDGDAATRTLRWNGQLELNQTVTITIDGTVRRNAGLTTVSNQGTVNFDADGNGSNESSTRTDDPAVGGLQDPTLFDVLAPLAIPVNSPWALALLLLAMGGVAGFAMRRKHGGR